MSYLKIFNVHFPIIFSVFLRNTFFIRPLIEFYRQLKQALFVRDVYASMFFCDFINMIIVIGFYSQFGVSSLKIFSFLTYFQIDSFPVNRKSKGSK